MDPFFDTNPQHLVLIPTLSVLTGNCEQCGNEGGVLIMISFLIWNAGFFFGGECSH